MNLRHGAIEFDHILFELCLLEGGIAPEEISGTIFISEYRGINIIPADLGLGGHVVGDKGLA